MDPLSNAFLWLIFFLFQSKLSHFFRSWSTTQVDIFLPTLYKMLYALLAPRAFILIIFLKKSGILTPLEITVFIIPNNFFFGNHCQNVISWGSPWSGPRPSRWLDLTQMVLDIQKQLHVTIFFIPNNFCFNNIAKKSFPGTPLGQVPDLAVRGRWTSPRWSWTFSSCPGLISGPRPFRWHLNLEPSVKTDGVSPFFLFTYSNYNIDKCGHKYL